MRICLILEGSYPYTHGGVSSWMHNYIQQMPETEFVLWVIGAYHKDQGKFFVQPPENVVEIHEVFLDDALKVRIEQDHRYHFKEEEIAALQALMDCAHPDWRVLCELYQTKQVKPGAFLMSEAFLDILTKLCTEQYPYAAFSDTFHTIRSMLLPVLYLLSQPIPDADMYHTICTGYGGLLATMASIIKKKPMMLTEHGIYSREREEEIIRASWVLPTFKRQWIKFFYMLSDAVYQQATVITSLFQRAKDTQIELGATPEKCHVIGNGINYARFSRIPMKKKNGTIDIAAVIRIAAIKDVKTLIYAYKELTMRVPNTRLHILGGVDDEEYAAECHALVHALRLETLSFVGQVDVEKYMEQIDFTVLTSISEGQPLSVLESFAAGRPAVTTDVGCCRELIRGGVYDPYGPAGYCVPPMNRQALADALEWMCRDDEKRLEMGRAGQQRAEHYFRQESIMKKYREMYEEVNEKWQESVSN